MAYNQTASIMRFFGCRQARELFTASACQVKGEINLHESVPKILAPSISGRTAEMRSSLMAMLERMAQLDGKATESQRKIIDCAASVLKLPSARTTQWS